MKIFTQICQHTAIARVLAAGIIAGAIGGGTAASAQETPVPAAQAGSPGPEAGIVDIVVTARRVSENIQRVPVAVTAVTGDVLQRKSILKVEDLSQAVPGFTAQASFQSGAPVYTIRGQHGDTNPTANTEPAVQVYFAEMNQARAIGTTGSFFDIASVQVLKGPQGTLFGRNSTGGAVLITPRAPEHEFGGYLQGSLGDFSLRDFEGALNLPLGQNVALRIAGKVSRRDGYIKNLVTGDDAGEINNNSARASLLLEPTDNVKSTFIGTYYDSFVDGNTIRLDSIAAPYFQATFGAPPPFGFGAGGAAFIASVFQADANAERALGPYRTRATSLNFTDEKIYSIQNNTEIELSNEITIKNIIGYRNTKQNQSSDFAGSTFTDYFTNAVDSTSRLFSEELQLQGKFGDLDFVVGGYLLRERTRLGAVTSVFAPIVALFPGFGLEAAFPSRNLVNDNYKTDSQSIFVHGTYQLSSLAQGLSISAGVRLTHDSKKATFRFFDISGTPAAVNGYNCVLTGQILATADFANCSTPGKLTSTEPTYDVSLNYQATENLLLYIAHRRGYRAGGFDIIPGDLSVLSFKPEFVDDAEFGVKSKFHLGAMPVRLNAATYFQKYKDIQLLTSVRQGSSVANRTINVAAADIYGGELELTVQPTPDLELTGTYAYVHPNYTKFDVPYTTLDQTVTTTLDISDSHFPYVATHQWSISGRYSLPLPEEYGHIALSATWYGQSKMLAAESDSANSGPDGFYLNVLNRGTKIPARDLVNLRVDWNNVAGHGFDLAVFVNNVADTAYKSTVLGLNGALGFTSVGYGPPRMFGAVLKIPLGSEAH